MFLAFDLRLLLIILMGFVDKDECCQNAVGSKVANATEFQLTHHYPIQNLSYDPFFFHKLTPQSDRSVWDDKKIIKSYHSILLFTKYLYHNKFHIILFIGMASLQSMNLAVENMYIAIIGIITLNINVKGNILLTHKPTYIPNVYKHLIKKNPGLKEHYLANA